MASTPPSEQQCTANLKTCPILGGGCGYRYVKGDAKWQDGGKCPQCGRDRRCGRWANTGYSVCQVHGAGSIHKGRFPKNNVKNVDIFKPNLPQRMLDTYYSALTDERLYQLRSDIAILEARKQDLIKRVDTGDSTKFRTDLKELTNQFKMAQATGDADQSKAILLQLFTLIDRGYNDEMAWQNVQTTIESKGKQLEREFRHLEITHKVITVDKFMNEVAKLLDIIKGRFGDEGYKLVLGDVYELLNIGNPNQSAPHPLIVSHPHSLENE